LEAFTPASAPRAPRQRQPIFKGPARGLKRICDPQPTSYVVRKRLCSLYLAPFSQYFTVSSFDTRVNCLATPTCASQEKENFH